MAYYAYHRTSTEEQSLDRGINEIRQFCEERGIKLFKNRIFTDQHTGKSFDRPGYKILRELLDKGDTLIITELDRLGRVKEDILKELRYFKEHGIRVMILEIPTTLINIEEMDNSLSAMLLDTINTVIIEVYAAMAQAENEKRAKRQKEGYEALKLRGEWDKIGRPRRLSSEQFAVDYKLVLEGKMRPCEFIRNHGLSRSTYYRYRDEYYKSLGENKEDAVNDDDYIDF